MIQAKAVIGIPVYNEIAYLNDTLTCLSAVSADVEVKFFIVDNHSTDGSWELIQKYAGQDNRFVIYRHGGNIGAVANFEFVFTKSKSDYFMWMGAHDLISPRYPAAALAALDANSSIAYAAPMPCAFFDSLDDAKYMPQARYNFDVDPLVRYMQSVGGLSNCTLVYSMFRRRYLDDFVLKPVISMDHILISHLLWYGAIEYLENNNYYRRFFKEDRDSTQAERITGVSEQRLDRFEFIEYYAEDFKKIYNRPGDMQDYLVMKMLSLLEKKYKLNAFFPGSQQEI